MPDAPTPRRASPSPAPRKRSGRRRRATAGDLTALRRELWYGLRRVGEVFDAPDAEPHDLCRAANSLAALANAYTRLTEASDLVPRLEAIEAAQAAAAGGRQ